MNEIIPSELPLWLGQVKRNYCRHKPTNELLRGLCPSLPEPEKGFWDGEGWALAVRPKGGVRAAAEKGDTNVSSLEDVEIVLFEVVLGKWGHLKEFKVWMAVQKYLEGREI